MSILIDTNIALYLFDGDFRIAQALEEQIVHVSFLTELELLSYPRLSPGEESVIHNFLNDCVVVDINTQIKKGCVQFRRRYGLRLPDSIIAATAYYLGIPLISADKDFLAIEEINFIFYDRK